jgi:hypothetical protein
MEGGIHRMLDGFHGILDGFHGMSDGFYMLGGWIQGLSDALQVPAGFRWTLEELDLAETPSQNYYSGGYKFWWNKFIPELVLECSPECTGMECHWNPVPGVFINYIYIH